MLESNSFYFAKSSRFVTFMQIKLPIELKKIKINLNQPYNEKNFFLVSAIIH